MLSVAFSPNSKRTENKIVTEIHRSPVMPLSSQKVYLLYRKPCDHNILVAQADFRFFSLVLCL